MKLIRKSGLFIFILTFFCILNGPTASAQEVKKLFEMDIEDLMGIKVAVASRSERSIKDLPSTVHIITRDEILKNNYSTLVDALKDIPGVKVHRVTVRIGDISGYNVGIVQG